jgi:hypothetical protein
MIAWWERDVMVTRTTSNSNSKGIQPEYFQTFITYIRLRYSSETPTFYQNDLAMKKTAEVKGSKHIAV